MQLQLQLHTPLTTDLNGWAEMDDLAVFLVTAWHLLVENTQHVGFQIALKFCILSDTLHFTTTYLLANAVRSALHDGLGGECMLEHATCTQPAA
jgi:hypothetical protein